MKCSFMSQLDSSVIRNCITVAITAAKFDNNANVFEMTAKWRHVVMGGSHRQEVGVAVVTPTSLLPHFTLLPLLATPKAHQICLLISLAISGHYL